MQKDTVGKTLGRETPPEGWHNPDSDGDQEQDGNALHRTRTCNPLIKSQQESPEYGGRSGEASASASAPTPSDADHPVTLWLESCPVDLGPTARAGILAMVEVAMAERA